MQERCAAGNKVNQMHAKEKILASKNTKKNIKRLKHEEV